jgi:multidrug efflux pump subunit AcrA (membrane-fusion protein)
MPDRVEHVYTTQPGHIETILVEPGMAVEAGAPLLTLKNQELEAEFQLVKRMIAEVRSELRTQTALGSSETVALSQQRLSSLEEQLIDVKTRRDRLQVLAPAAGIIIEAHQSPEATNGLQLGKFHGDPLDKHNVGAFVEKQTSVCSVAPSPNLRAIVILDQTYREYVAPGTAIRLRFDHLPNRVFRAQVAEISQSATTEVSPLMSSKFGGLMATMTDPVTKQEHLTHAAFSMIVPVDTVNLRNTPTTGMRGSARMIVKGDCLATWCWRKMRETFHFTM